MERESWRGRRWKMVGRGRKGEVREGVGRGRKGVVREREE